ncbi:MAG: right-handed parallel beta-helix repeat-containing protein [Verrucomicrobiae bacterium]|nr:right-handed parallel beta-helix repeat-containing protein [Verrucomicrobiae bacterium]
MSLTFDNCGSGLAGWLGIWMGTAVAASAFAEELLQPDLAPPTGPTRQTFVVRDAGGVREAMGRARPGTTILLRPGRYPGGFHFRGLQGTAEAPVVLGGLDPEDPPVIEGGANGIHLSEPVHVELRDLVFREASGNGLNIDDGGTFETPARNVVLRRLRVEDVGPTGNRDGIKLSGVVGFLVEACVIQHWGSGGSGIDMVGCHDGLIVGNVLRHTEAVAASNGSGVQAKGGTSGVTVRRNRFEHAGARAVNIGGSTGLEFFRPPLVHGTEHWEARNIRVEGNTFIGSSSPIAFVGVDGAEVRFNTIYRPQRWAIRILQETTAPGFVACRGGRFTDNLVAFHSASWSGGGVNVGSNTAPGTFLFARNWWHCMDDPARSRPTLPVPETDGIYGTPLEFRDVGAGDLRLAGSSPARVAGAEALP